MLLDPRARRRITLCIETGVQNLALTLALIALSFNNQFSIVVYSYVFGFVICIECAIFTVFARWSVVRLPLCGVDPSELEQPQVLPMTSAVSSDKDGLAAAESAELKDDAAPAAEPKAVNAAADGGTCNPFALWGGGNKAAVAARV